MKIRTRINDHAEEVVVGTLDVTEYDVVPHRWLLSLLVLVCEEDDDVFEYRQVDVLSSERTDFIDVSEAQDVSHLHGDVF